jgi:hypothetical protein
MKEIEKKLPLQNVKSDIKHSENKDKHNINGDNTSSVHGTREYADNSGNCRDSNNYKDISVNGNVKFQNDSKFNKETKAGKDSRSNKKTKENKNAKVNKDVNTNKDFRKKSDRKNSTDNKYILSTLLGSKWRHIGKLLNKNNWFNTEKKIQETGNTQYAQEGKSNKQGNDYPFIEEVESDKEILAYEKKTYVMAIGAVLLGIILLVVILRLKLLYNTFGTQIDSVKLIGCLLIICSGEIYIFSKLFNKNNQITKMVTTVEYIEPNLEEVMEVKNRSELYLDKQSNIDIEIQPEIQPKSDIAIQMKFNGQTYSNIMSESEFRIGKENKEGSKDDFDGEQENTTVLWKEEGNDSEKTKILAELSPKIEYYLESCDDANNTVIPIGVFPFIIGKLAAGVNYRIQDPAVSRRHAKFIKEKEDIYLLDLDSTNGTFLNGMRLTAHKLYKLSFDDEILIAQNIFYLKIK